MAIGLVVGEDVDAAVLIGSLHRAAQAFGKDPPAEGGRREDHGDVHLVHGQRGRDLGSDEPSADDHRRPAGRRLLTQL